MIDEPGPWGTGPFTLVQGASSILTRNVVMTPSPYTASWLIEREDRSPQVVLEANPTHWNREDRGPRVQRAVFRNDLTPSRALELCLTTDGEVDIVTEVSPADAARVEASAHARLVTADANRVLACIVNRDGPLASVDLRRAVNLAVDRERVLRDGLAGYGTVIPAMTPPWCSGFPAGAAPYPHDPARARSLWSGWPDRPLRLVTPAPFAGIAQLVASDLRRALAVDVKMHVVPEEAALAGSRALVEKKLPQAWDLLLHAWFDLSSEAPPAAVHREFLGRDGAFRAGPVDAGFEELFNEMEVAIDPQRLVDAAERIDAYVFDQALALFLCAPQALYAVNNAVSFGPYRTTFEIAEVTVDETHWSRRSPGVSSGSPDVSSTSADVSSGSDGGAVTAEPVSLTTTPPDKPGFSGASGNAC